MNTISNFLKSINDFATRAIHAGQDPEQWSSLAVVPPITMATTFKQHSPAEPKEFYYGRSGNPSRSVLENCIASLDDGKYALCFSSGLGALTTVLSMLNAGDHLVCGNDMYGGSNRLINEIFIRLGIKSTMVDTTNVSNIENVIKQNTKLVFIETPTNPLFKVTDIRKVASLTKSRNLILVIDNTFLTSYFQRPLSLGADVVLHSLTKYMNGHTDVVMGALVTNSEEIYEKLAFLQKGMGIIPSPFDCSMVNRSLKTLTLRMREHMKNGLEIAKFLEKHPAVEKVIHPGLPSHPQHEVTKSQTYGHCGMLAFYLKGDLEKSRAFLKALKVFTIAESLGGFESLASIPSLMSHASVPTEQKQILGITDNLIRLSVGLESAEDLIKDLDQALKVVKL